MTARIVLAVLALTPIWSLPAHAGNVGAGGGTGAGNSAAAATTLTDPNKSWSVQAACVINRLPMPDLSQQVHYDAVLVVNGFSISADMTCTASNAAGQTDSITRSVSSNGRISLAGRTLEDWQNSPVAVCVTGTVYTAHDGAKALPPACSNT